MSFPKNAKRATLTMCPAARSRQMNERGLEVFDSATNEVLGNGKSAHVAWYVAGIMLQERMLNEQTVAVSKESSP